LDVVIDPTPITPRRSVQCLRAFLARSWRKQHQQDAKAAATYFPSPLAVPLLVFSSEYEGRAWRQISPDVELINLPGSRDDWVTRHPAALMSYVRARIQSIGDSKVEPKRHKASPDR